MPGVIAKYVCSGSQLVKFLDSPGPGHSVRLFREHSVLIDAEDDKAASDAFLAATGFRPQYIGAREVAAHCEHCERPIFADETGRWSDGEVSLCAGCAPTAEDLEIERLEDEEDELAPDVDFD